VLGGFAVRHATPMALAGVEALAAGRQGTVQ
jgi:hypothetical protein